MQKQTKVIGPISILLKIDASTHEHKQLTYISQKAFQQRYINYKKDLNF